MKKETSRTSLLVGILLLVVFIVFTFLVRTFDVQAIGPEGTSVGFAGINAAFHNLTGYQATVYKITEYAGYLALLVAACFALLAFVQLVTRRSFKKVDGDLYVLAGVYAVMLICYVFFEECIINYRPVILDEGLEASYPSSHTMMALVILLPAIGQVKRRLPSGVLRTLCLAALSVLLLVIVAGRLVSGVHWLTDIVAGILLGLGLVLVYNGIAGRYIENSKD